MPDTVLITLYEGHYHYGVAGLLNSLAAASFEGLVCVGYKGSLPPWIAGMQQQEGRYVLNETISVVFESITANMHFGYYKPYFLKEMLQRYTDAQSVYYFDPDIVVTGPWHFYRQWSSAGVALCLDSNFAYVHHNHPWRVEWQLLAAQANLAESNKVDYYVNSGFIGVKRSAAAILDRWIDLTQCYRDRGGDVSQFEKSEDRAFKGDQDLLNAAITVSPDIPFSIVGQEGMGFTSIIPYMAHAVSPVKPWKKKFLLSALKGLPPTLAEKAYWNHVSGPLFPFASGYIKRKRLSAKIASFLSRFYRKG